MNAESLIGKVLGTCTLQKLVGQGGMGAVYLAQQSRPRRQVAVKVLLPMTPLNSNQLAAFLERFRRETDAAASLEHPHIMPVHEYGEQDGIAYLVMPYIAGGTLRDELEREGPLPLPKALDYIEQLAIALDFAHEHGVIHRDIKPANIMVTAEGRLLLTDFGLVKIVAAGQKAQVRLTGAGAPVGTPDYMAPEQVIGEEVDTRADLYSLGVILFQMVTGTTPFHGETPMQIAAQHLQIPPPSPQMLRPDLPITAEQVILRAMAKRPGDRYMYAQDLANAFRSALIKSGINVEATTKWAGLTSGTTSSRLAVPKGQFDPIRQTASMPKISKEQIQANTQKKQGGLLTRARSEQTENPAPVAPGGLLSRAAMNPAPVAHAAPTVAPQGGGLLSKTGKFPMMGTGVMPIVQPADKKPGQGLLSRSQHMQPQTIAKTNTSDLHLPKETQTHQQEQNTFWSKEAPASPQANGMHVPVNQALATTGTHQSMELPRRSNTVTLNDPVKVVKVPIGAGRFITGLLPYIHKSEEEHAPTVRPWVKFALIALVLCIVLGSVGIFVYSRNGSTNQVAPTAVTQQTQTNKDNRTAEQIQATSTAMANTIIEDPLDRNINAWPEENGKFEFKNNAYHITDQSGNGSFSYVQKDPIEGAFTYTLTMQQVKGDIKDKDNTFGMVFDFSSVKKGDTIIYTFYSFEIANTKDGAEYKVWRYDNSKKDAEAWQTIKDGSQPIGREFHKGTGPGATNTISIRVNQGTFTVTVNGVQLPKTFKDNTYKTGTVGMLVNAKGSEVLFKNLRVTHK